MENFLKFAAITKSASVRKAASKEAKYYRLGIKHLQME